MALLRRERAKTRPRSQVHALTAAAEKIDPTNRKQISRLKRRRQQWQEEAYAYYDEIGELKYVVRFLANAISKVRLYPAWQDEPDHPPVALGRFLEELEEGSKGESAEGEGHIDVPPEVSLDAIEMSKDIVYSLRAPVGGQPEILRSMAANLVIAGEFFLGELAAGGEDPDDPEKTLEETRWDVYSVDEIRMEDKLQIIDRPGNLQGRKMTEKDSLDRMWIRHPRIRSLADSSFRGILGSAETLLILDRTIRACIKSRTSAGLLLMPQELSFGPEDETEEGGDGEERQDPFEEELDKAMTTPILDEGSASAVVPLRVTGPGEFLGDVRVVELGRKLDAELLTARNEEIDRLGGGLDLPVELMTGMAASNHWTSWLIDQSLFRSHLEPLVVSIVDFLTAVVLRPGLIARGLDPEIASRIVCWYDATPVLTRVNVQQDAQYLHGNLALSDAAARAAMGFDESDAPDEGEITRRLVQHQRTWDPVLIRYMLELAFPDFDPPPPVSSTGVPVTIGPPEALPPPPEERRAEGPPPESGKPGESEDAGEGPKVPLDSRDIRSWVEQGPEEFAALVAEALRARPPGNGKSPPVSQLGRRLSALDRQLMHRLLAAGDAAMRFALTRAGARIRSRPALRAAIPKASKVENANVAAFLGAERVHEEFSDEQLLQGSFDDFSDQFGEWTGVSQDQALLMLADEGELSEDDLATLRSQLGAGRDRAGEYLVAALMALGAQRLYNPTAEVGPGEATPSLSVPAGLIREAMAIAGGAQNVERTPAGGVVVDSGRPVGGATMGEAVRGALLGAGFEERGWTWEHDDPPTDFVPHLALDNGDEYVGDDDDRLTNDGSWPDTDFFFCGDHLGCMCIRVPVLVLTLPEGVTADEAEVPAAAPGA